MNYLLAVTGGRNSPQRQQLATADKPLSVKKTKWLDLTSMNFEHENF